MTVANRAALLKPAGLSLKRPAARLRLAVILGLGADGSFLRWDIEDTPDVIRPDHPRESHGAPAG